MKKKLEINLCRCYAHILVDDQKQRVFNVFCNKYGTEMFFLINDQLTRLFQ
jgi:hypothetical protein